MTRFVTLPRLAALLTSTCLALPLSAQTADEVRSDVLSALATPLPITIVGPLMTPDVTVTPEGDGFRAVMQDTSVMGLFPFGEVTMLLTPLDGDRYQISEMTFPTQIDIPGVALLTYSNMTIEGTWLADERSYTDLTWTISDLTLAPGNGAPGRISIGELSLNVVKEPDETDTESRFEIALADLAVTDAGPQDIRAGAVRALLAANGEQPVDLYSLIRETILRSTLNDDGQGLMALGQSLLGNTYSTVTLDLTGEDLDIRDASATGEAYLTAGTMTARLDMADVAPRDWGAAEITVALQDLEQRDVAPEYATLTMGEGVLAVRVSELPVADMFTMVTTLSGPPRGRPVPAQVLVDGLMEFGALEVRTSGSDVRLEAFDWRWTEDGGVEEPLFTSSYDSWSSQFGISGLNENAGQFAFAVEATGGTIVPQQAMGPEAEPHLEAWFPEELRVQTALSELNEGFLKQLLEDVQIARIDEPAELVLPMLLYAASVVPQVTSGENLYETGLFRVTQSADLQFYPTEIISLSPYTGTTQITFDGLEDLSAYIDRELVATGEMRPDEASAVQSVLTVMGNLAERDADGVASWTIARPDLYTREVIVNGVTLRYPEIAQFLPMAMFGMRF